MNVKDIARVIRPQQWIKNVFVLVPLFFGGSLLDTTDIIAAVTAAMAFCFISSSIYCLNDIIDVEDDRRHPVKRNRPIASGKVSVKQGYVCMAMMVALSFGLTTLIGEQAMGVAAALGTYFLLNIAYCLWLKRFAIVDVCVIAFGFDDVVKTVYRRGDEAERQHRYQRGYDVCGIEKAAAEEQRYHHEDILYPLVWTDYG